MKSTNTVGVRFIARPANSSGQLHIYVRITVKKRRTAQAGWQKLSTLFRYIVNNIIYIPKTEKVFIEFPVIDGRESITQYTNQQSYLPYEEKKNTVSLIKSF